jgi:large subunit ribosomal protein L25
MSPKNLYFFMSQHTIEATTRALKGRKTNALRVDGLVPAIVYGNDTEPRNITINRNEFVKLYNATGKSTLVELKIDGKDDLHVLIQNYQLDPVKDTVTHVDFRSIDMNKEIEAVVSLSLVGESMAVKALGGTLVLSRESVTIKALPANLISAIEVDLGKVAEFSDVIRVSDLIVPEGVSFVDSDDLALISVSTPRSKAQMDALNDEVTEQVEDVKVEGEKKE